MTTDERIREIMEGVNVLQEPGAIVELRILGVGDYSETWFGFYDADHRQQLASDALSHDGRAAIFTTLNVLHPGLLARSPNRLTRATKKISAASDRDIIRRRWLPVDFDPVRPAGISASDEEKECAHQAARECWQWLKDKGWPEPIIADSGNGFHLPYRLDLPNDDESKRLVQAALQALATRFNSEKVEVDITNFNAAKPWKLYGTTACKGASLPGRPHRLSKMIRVPGEVAQ